MIIIIPVNLTIAHFTQTNTHARHVTPMTRSKQLLENTNI